jgi:hypothetical protein
LGKSPWFEGITKIGPALGLLPCASYIGNALNLRLHLTLKICRFVRDRSGRVLMPSPLWIFGVRYTPGHKGVGILRALLFSREDIHDIKMPSKYIWEITPSAFTCKVKHKGESGPKIRAHMRP